MTQVIGSEAVVKVCDALESQTKQALEEMKISHDQFSAVAIALEGENDAAKVQELRKALQSVLTHESELNCHIEALSAFRNRYSCTTEKTDFKGLLQQLFEESRRSVPSSTSTCADLKSFDRMVWNVHHQGQAMEGEEDEELLVDPTQGHVFKNPKCPLSGRDIEELDDPVEDQQGFIYEKELIERMITRSRTNEVNCPQIGTTHTIKLKDLKPAYGLKARVERENKRRRIAETQGLGGSGNEVKVDLCL
ncbi:hypothetical protein CYMTET_26326 [Cymbomonas tetramitiformis]|uniref:SP-RING-type domain-containing protein n=1 Tax=Cymbomonas tetramitiformis TaxID=36881 RepID=A0AAE0FSI9_9CHLO|nr:hypothetical protein CYMTET_26326 [Cymbomonas tetramitiformis]